MGCVCETQPAWRVWSEAHGRPSLERRKMKAWRITPELLQIETVHAKHTAARLYESHHACGALAL